VKADYSREKLNELIEAEELPPVPAGVLEQEFSHKLVLPSSSGRH